jgi:DNA helicase HerA-like ATPase
MEGKPFSGQANMLARVTMVEITRMISERLLELLQARPRDPGDESANLCLVFEEAHSLVPEWNSATNEAERQAVNGTARAVLQGRKYGFGCLLVTQRTANVTKSILNQCNTVFGMRVYDATGMGFLENYIGPTYAQLLASLRDRQAVVFGRASSCNSPLIVDLNDGAVLQERYWAARVTAIPPTRPPEVEEPELPEELRDAIPSADDDIPF